MTTYAFDNDSRAGGAAAWEKPTERHYAMPFGAQITPEGGVRFRLWAPNHDAISLKIKTEPAPRAMTALADGWHELHVRDIGPGANYRFVLPDGFEVPDPASRFQPEDVHLYSEVIDPRAYQWSDGGWNGRAWEEVVLYELHVGAFTPEGTFRAAIDRLDHLRDLGVTAIELMPIADFPGHRNWGYDGVLLFAPESSYGRPDDLKAFVDAAHRRGIAVILDVVYNHFGPDGNYLPLYSPIFTETHHTPWGAAVNYDADCSDVVRRLIVCNAVFWIREYHLDGLRLDAVHAIIDDSPEHLLHELAGAVREAAGRHVHLILENEENEAGLLKRDGNGVPLQFTAQWNDDIHHVLHTAASGESSGYYVDYVGDTRKLGRAIAEGFVFQGELMPYRGEARGEPSGFLPPTAFVSFTQNHDQIGNRAFGDRITATVPVEAARAIAAVSLLGPQIPMLFMGEEWAAAQPFPFFCDFEPELADAVRNGRRAEFAKFPEFQDPEQRERIPDPTAEATFLSAKLDWDDVSRGEHAATLDWYRRILAVRHAEIVPLLAAIPGDASRFEVLGDMAVRVRWLLANGLQLVLTANLKATPLDGVRPPEGRTLWTEGGSSAAGLGPWTVVWTLVVEGTP
jgi:maltooligosyltrehalose trehalohydrolase